MATQETGVSYRRSRNYREKFQWTFELNQNLYQFYKMAREDPSIGYMKRIKSSWDVKYPNYSHFSAKQLRQQATFIEKRYNSLPRNINNKYTVNSPVKSTFEKTERNLNHNQNKNTNTNVNNNTEIGPTPLRGQALATSEHIEMSEEYKWLKTHLTARFKENVAIYINKPLNERMIVTRVDRKPTDLMLDVIDQVAKEYLAQSDVHDFWTLNVLMYCAAITILQHVGIKEFDRNHNTQPKWITSLQKNVDRLRKNIGQLDTIIRCKVNNEFTNHQLRLYDRLYKIYGNCRRETLTGKLCALKHELRAVSQKLCYRKKLRERRSINRKFALNPQAVYRNMKGDTIKVVTAPTRDELESFWGGIWNVNKQHNCDAVWLNELQNEYCTNVSPKKYDITSEILLTVVEKLPNGKSPGRDLIVGYWYRKLTFYRSALVKLFKKTMDAELDVPDWLAVARTTLVPKNQETHVTKNYRSIACLNVMYKLYTGCLNVFLQDH